MAVIRAFIAIELSPEIRSRLLQVENQLKEKLPGKPVRWVAVENIHLTLMFLGDVSVSNLELLKDALRAEVEKHTQFELIAGNLGAFPSVNRPRVIWVGVDAPRELRELQADIEARMQHLGYPREERPFSPHLTLGRIARGISLSEISAVRQALQSTTVGILGTQPVQEVCLFKSDLRPTGAVYTRLYAVKLRN